MADVRRAAGKVHKLEGDLEASRARLDALLVDRHEAGATITALAREAGMSRQAVYNAIDRARPQLDS